MSHRWVAYLPSCSNCYAAYSCMDMYMPHMLNHWLSMIHSGYPALLMDPWCRVVSALHMIKDCPASAWSCYIWSKAVSSRVWSKIVQSIKTFDFFPLAMKETTLVWGWSGMLCAWSNLQNSSTMMLRQLLKWNLQQLGCEHKTLSDY